MMPITAAALYIGVNILLLLFLSFRVVGRRRSAKVSLGTGGDSDLEIRTRAHGNAAEYIPITMLGLFVMTQFAVPIWAIHAVGGTFTLGRLLHAYGLSASVQAGRALGMVLTWLGMLGAGVGVIWLALA